MRNEQYNTLAKLVRKWEKRSHFLGVFSVKTTVITSIILLIILSYLINNG
ncbi:hypothetical protein [Tenacibaculum insulae]